MSQTKEVRYTARSITPPPKEGSKSRSKSPAGGSKSPAHSKSPAGGSKSPARSKSPAGSKSPVRSRSKSPAGSKSPVKSRSRSRSPAKPRERSRSRSRSEEERNPKRRSRSRSKSRSRSRSPRKSRERSRSRSEESRNPGNNLYVTGLSMRTTSSELEKLFSREGKVQRCEIVLDPRTKESRGFAFVTMGSVDEAERCIKYLNRTVVDGRRLVIEKAKRIRERTPTPGQYRGAKPVGESHRRPGPPRGRSPPPRYGRREPPARYGQRDFAPRYGGGARDWDRRDRDVYRRPRDSAYPPRDNGGYYRR